MSFIWTNHVPFFYTHPLLTLPAPPSLHNAACNSLFIIPSNTPYPSSLFLSVSIFNLSNLWHILCAHPRTTYTIPRPFHSPPYPTTVCTLVSFLLLSLLHFFSSASSSIHFPELPQSTNQSLGSSPLTYMFSSNTDVLSDAAGVAERDCLSFTVVVFAAVWWSLGSWLGLGKDYTPHSDKRPVDLNTG